MKITVKRLKEIIKEELGEIYLAEYDEEDEAIDKYRAARRAKGYYPARHSTGGYEDTRSPAEIDQARKEGMVEATRNILKMFGGGLMVDPKTYAAVEELAPELLDRLSISGSRRRE